MAKIAQPPVLHKAYRHFAVITVVIAALLALFTSGENSEAVAVQIEQHEREAQLQRISAERTRPAQLARREQASESSFAASDAQVFGKPMDQIRSSSGSSTANTGGATRTGEHTVIPGYSREYLNSLTEQQYRQLLDNLQQAGMFSPEEREQNLANLSAGSQRRSGVATPSESMVN